jgi:hypothetical protein
MIQALARNRFGSRERRGGPMAGPPLIDETQCNEAGLQNR